MALPYCTYIVIGWPSHWIHFPLFFWSLILWFTQSFHGPTKRSGAPHSTCRHNPRGHLPGLKIPLDYKVTCLNKTNFNVFNFSCFDHFLKRDTLFKGRIILPVSMSVYYSKLYVISYR